MRGPCYAAHPGSWYVCFGYVLPLGVFFFPITYEGDAMLYQAWFDDMVECTILSPSFNFNKSSWNPCVGYDLPIGVFFSPITFEGDATLRPVWFDDMIQGAMHVLSHALNPGSWYACVGYDLPRGVFFSPSHMKELPCYTRSGLMTWFSAQYYRQV